jgi:NhaA family Na+:H+ antiporter
MTSDAGARLLAPPVDGRRDHILGPSDATITLVEFGSYACPRCRAANEEIAKLRDRFGERLRYVFRHRPLTDSRPARRAAELVECAADTDEFWSAHVTLMTRSTVLTESDLDAVAADLRVEREDHEDVRARRSAAAARVDEDVRSAKASGVLVTPTFFIGGRRYDGPWDETSLAEALEGSLGYRFQSAAVGFASWAPSTGLLLALATIIAVLITNSTAGAAFEAFWHAHAGFTFGTHAFGLSLQHWINDGLLTLFFLVVGLEVKREFTVGRLANWRSAALPIAAAIGGLLLPALVYLALVPSGRWALGAGVPMPTDTAFAVALIVLLGRRVPVELRVFLTAASIVDDIGTILVVAIFYSGHLDAAALALAALVLAALVALNRAGVYRALPYAVLGVALWALVHAGGLHATLAGVLLALVVPTRPPPNLRALTAQAEAIIATETRRGEEVLRHGPSVPALRTLDAIHDRIESPADRLLRHVEPWSSYVILPLFALANAGVVLSAGVFDGRESLAVAVVAGLLVGKPLGFLLASQLAVRSGLAVKPSAYSWQQLAACGAVAGIGFTMSLFIAGQAFPDAADFAAAKIAVFGASVACALVGGVALWYLGRPRLTADVSPNPGKS